MSRTYTLADVTAVLRAADDDYHDGIDALVDIRTRPTNWPGTAELLVQLTPPDPGHGTGAVSGASRFRVTITPDPAVVPPDAAPVPAVPATQMPTDLLDGCADPTVATTRAAQIITDSHSGWGAPARRLLAVLLQAAALDGADLDQVSAWAADLTPAVIEQINAILTRPHVPQVPVTRQPRNAPGQTVTLAITVQQMALLPYRSSHTRTRDSVTATITAALTACSGGGAR